MGLGIEQEENNRRFMSSIDFNKLQEITDNRVEVPSTYYNPNLSAISTSNCISPVGGFSGVTGNTNGPIGNWGNYVPNWSPGWNQTTTTYNPIYQWPDSEMNEVKKDLKELKKMMGLILEGDENPALLEKYKNLKKAYEEYKFFRDLILNEEEKKVNEI